MNDKPNPITSTGRIYGHPLARPLETEPDTGRDEAGEMLRIALAHAGTIGAFDRTIITWLCGTGDGGIVATVASLLRRAWQEGVKAGRREVLDEAGDLTVDVRKVAADLAKAAAPVVEGQVGALDGDRLLAAVDTAVIDLADAVEHLSDPPACGGCEHPNCPTRPGVLCPRSAVDMARVDALRAYGAEDQGDDGHELDDQGDDAQAGGAS